MASSGAVYQPTTVTYDDPSLTESGHHLPQSHGPRRWSATNRASAPVSYLARAARGRGRCSTCTPSRRTLATLYCSSGAACAAIGLTLVIHGAIGCDDSCDSAYVTVIIVGVLTLLLGVVLLLLYLRHTRRCCFTFFGRKDLGGAPTMPSASSTHESANLQLNNPSTDHLLIGAQPTASNAHAEHAHLMPKGPCDNTNTADDPRILLRPLNAAADVDEGA